jgi:signal transduction histidine kinase
MTRSRRKGSGGRYALVISLLVVLWGVVAALALYEPLSAWLAGTDRYDRDGMIEWLEETRNAKNTLPEMLDGYLDSLKKLEQVPPPPAGQSDDPHLDDRERAKMAVALKYEEIYEHLQMLGNPTKTYGGQLPLFPVVYRLEVLFDNPRYAPIVWDSELPYPTYLARIGTAGDSQIKVLHYRLRPEATAEMVYQLHAYNKRQQDEQERKRRVVQLVALAVPATLLGGVWLVLVGRRDRERERQKALAQQQADEAERRVLELRSQLYASIGIMAGSYAHNIKNLLVRPNDLLQRCLESDRLSSDQSLMLHEVRQTLGTVTERLQQILRTVRRDPGRSEHAVLDLNALLGDMEHTWKELARERWKLDLSLDLAPQELLVEGDASHLQQAVENLLFNARDATFEMRGRLRELARREDGAGADRKQALIAAAGWRGRITIRSRREADAVVLEVSDNGVGMSDEVRRRCTEPHFSTKRNNALYEGLSSGMGLGLSFVVTVLEYQGARLDIESRPLEGATFRIRFPPARPQGSK